MALPNINFVQSSSGLGRPLTGTDHVSGMVHYYPSGRTLPSGFSSSDRIKKIFSVADAVALGITGDSLGETKSTATYVVSNKGAVGDVVKITCNTIEGAKLGVPVTIINYTQVTADVTSTTTCAAGLAAAINAGTATHGFTATSSTATLTITAPAGEGIFLNSGTPYTVTITGTVAGTLTQNVVTGVASWIDTLYYNISEYFRIQPKGELYVGLYVEETTYAFADITSVITYAGGAIKQLSVYQNNVAWVTGHATALQAIAAAAATVYKPVQILYTAEISGTASVASLTDISTLTAPKVSVSIAQDGKAKGYHLFKAVGKSIGCVGALLGAVSFAAVSDSIAWIQKFNMVTGSELDTLCFANGQYLSALADSQFSNLNDYAYIFLLKQIGISGSFWSDSKTAVISTSDYSTIENNRVYDKITRVVRAALLPALSSPLKVNADGTLSATTIGYFTSLANRPIEQMEADNELSAHKIIINPNQNVLATSTLELTLQNVPLGVARIIKVNVGFVKSV